MSDNIEYNLPNDAYVNFDATSLKDFMIEQLNEGGVFTDQNYEGSNIAAILDVLAYYTHVLIFYLNQTSSEAMFSQTQIYENMNRIVKLIDYRPTGKQTSMTPIACEASADLPIGNYKIRKYSYFLTDNIQYTFIDNYSFDKSLSSVEAIKSLEDNAILFQGTVGEYPLYTAEGIEYESFPIVVDNLVYDDSRFISHGTISVCVKEIDSDIWYEYEEVDSLFLTDTMDRVFTLRLNENGHYEVKFGNGIFGRKLSKDDEVAVYYILSDGDKGIISKETIDGNKLYIYASEQWEKIYADINNSTSVDITATTANTLTFKNTSNSSIIYEAETVDDIRRNAPTFLSNQLRLVTTKDYERFINKTIPSILYDIKVLDNTEFMNSYIQYFYDICVDPNKVNRVILNQVNFADSCDFNNVNVFCVPSFTLTEDGEYPSFLSESFKNLIVDITRDKKMLSHEVVPRDPVYVAFDIGYGQNVVSKSLKDKTKLIITREKNEKINKNYLKSKIYEAIVNYFEPSTKKLGQTIDIMEITSNILSLKGVKSIKTENEEEGVYFNGISFITWNPVFEDVDENLITQNTTLPDFKFPYLYNFKSLTTKIEIVDE